MHPQRYAVLQKVIQLARGNRKDMIQRIADEIKGRLDDVGIKARVFGREKHLYAIYQKMRLKDQQFHSIMDILRIPCGGGFGGCPLSCVGANAQFI